METKVEPRYANHFCRLYETQFFLDRYNRPTLDLYASRMTVLALLHPAKKEINDFIKLVNPFPLANRTVKDIIHFYRVI